MDPQQLAQLYDTVQQLIAAGRSVEKVDSILQPYQLTVDQLNQLAASNAQQLEAQELEERAQESRHDTRNLSRAGQSIEAAIAGAIKGGTAGFSNNLLPDSFDQWDARLAESNPIAYGVGQLGSFIIPQAGAARALGAGARIASRAAPAIGRAARGVAGFFGPAQSGRLSTSVVKDIAAGSALGGLQGVGYADEVGSLGEAMAGGSAFGAVGRPAARIAGRTYKGLRTRMKGSGRGPELAEQVEEFAEPFFTNPKNRYEATLNRVYEQMDAIGVQRSRIPPNARNADELHAALDARRIYLKQVGDAAELGYQRGVQRGKPSNIKTDTRKFRGNIDAMDAYHVGRFASILDTLRLRASPDRLTLFKDILNAGESTERALVKFFGEGRQGRETFLRFKAAANRTNNEQDLWEVARAVVIYAAANQGLGTFAALRFAR